MMTSERLPMAWICATTRPKRRSAAGDGAQQVEEEEGRVAEAAQHAQRARAEPGAAESVMRATPKSSASGGAG